MYAFCTYCSKNKSGAPGEIPAIQRYLSARINAVYEAAQRLGLNCFILSAEYGLIAHDHPLPWYDHLLLDNEVPLLIPRVTEQIALHKITHLVYFTQPLGIDPYVRPYHAVLVEACNQASVPIFVVEIDESSLPDR